VGHRPREPARVTDHANPRCDRSELGVARAWIQYV
jgi:hypothetical protein